MIELLRRATPSRIAVIDDERSTTYGELVSAAEAVAAQLVQRGTTRFAILETDAVTVAALLAGAAAVGAEACQYPPTEDPAEIATLAERFDHSLIVTDRALPGLTTVAPSELIRATAGAPPDGPAASRPLLVLTTGTTGASRGVRHDWERLVRSVRRVQPTPDQRWLLAYGLHQFAGLQILLHVFASGATLVAPGIRRPTQGLAAMRGHAVEYASATPTYWRFLLAELRADGGPVPALVQITVGGEAVPAPLLDQLREVFPGARLSQVYAASEFGSSGSVRDGRNGLPLDVLDRADDADVAMKIVDGELWVRSRVGMLGYYGEPPVDADAWRPTGDLVDIVGDRIVFRGRTSEIINVGGVKVHPLPIEERVGAVPGVDVARVYGRPNALTGAIVAVEVVPSAGVDPAAVVEAVRQACADLPPAWRPRSVKCVDSVTTTGDKIVRRSV